MTTVHKKNTSVFRQGIAILLCVSMVCSGSVATMKDAYATDVHTGKKHILRSTLSASFIPDTIPDQIDNAIKNTIDGQQTTPAVMTGTVKDQVAHFWFDDQGTPVIQINRDVLDQTVPKDIQPEKESPRKRKQTLDRAALKLKQALMAAWKHLDESEKKALFDFQKANKIKRHTGEWMEIPLPITVDDVIKEGAQVTPFEIILNKKVMIEAPREFLEFVLLHGLRRSISRYWPDLQLHESALLQKTIAEIEAAHRAQEFITLMNDELGIENFYGSNWKHPLQFAHELKQIESGWKNITASDLDAICDLCVKSKRDTLQRKAALMKQYFPAEPGMPQPTAIFRERYVDKWGYKKVHLYFVYRLSQEVAKVVRVVPRETLDYITTDDTSESVFLKNYRVDIVRDAMAVGNDIANERELYARYPVLRAFIREINKENSATTRAVIHRMKNILSDEKSDTELKRAIEDILYSMAQNYPNEDIKRELNRFIFDRRTERPLEFPLTRHNFSAFDSSDHTVEVTFPIVNGQAPDVRVCYSKNGEAVETAAMTQKGNDENDAHYAWTVPVRDGWVHYAVQYKDPVSGLWYYCANELFEDEKYEKLNGLIKFQEDIRGDRVLGVRPAVYNLRLDTFNQPMVDENGNIMLGTFDDLQQQLIHLKKEGFDHIYIQVLENGAPGEAGPDASPFSPLSQVKICERIGGLKGLLELKKGR